MTDPTWSAAPDTVSMGDYLKVLAAEAELGKALEGALDALTEVLEQSCGFEDGVDSAALSAYANGLRLLAKHKRFVIETEVGRRIIGYWVPDDVEPVFCEHGNLVWFGHECGECE